MEAWLACLPRMREPLIEQRLTAYRIVDVAENFAHGFFERMRAAGVEGARPAGIGIDIDREFRAELGGMLFHPLGGTNKAELLAIPERDLHGALRMPAFFRHLAESAGGFEQRRGAGERIVRAANPRVMVIAGEKPLIGKFRAGNGRNYVIEWVRLIIHRHFHTNRR